jgi:hypothetical protein
MQQAEHAINSEWMIDNWQWICKPTNQTPLSTMSILVNSVRGQCRQKCGRRQAAWRLVPQEITIALIPRVISKKSPTRASA